MKILSILKDRLKLMHSTSETDFVNSSSIAEDEKQYYQPDEYYTLFSYPGTEMARRVVTFEERKKSSYPSNNGLYVAEILLLDYCNQGDYPKPKKGYPGFWWFEYGIRDVGSALISLEQRGFIQWSSVAKSLNQFTVNELKDLLKKFDLSTTGKKDDLINRVVENIELNDFSLERERKYELTELGLNELKQNEYVPYMHNHPHLTLENPCVGVEFNVWYINRILNHANIYDWRRIVGEIEKNTFGVNMAQGLTIAETQQYEKLKKSKSSTLEMRQYLSSMQTTINKGIKTSGDGLKEESQGLDFKKIGKDKEAIVQFYIAIGKRFDAPALYRETAILLRKYGMLEEELKVLTDGLNNVSHNNRHYLELLDRKQKVERLLRNTNEV